MSARKKKKSNKPAAQPADASLPQLRAGMPAHDNVVNVKEFESPTGFKGKIIRTTEADAYDQLPPAKKKREK